MRPWGQRVMTGKEPPVGIGADGRCFGSAALLHEGAAAVEFAAQRAVEEARHLAFERDAIGPGIGIGLGIGGKQRQPIGMAGAGEDGLGRSYLHEAAEIHDRHAVGDMAHHVQIMGDDEHGEAEGLAQVVEQVQHLALHRDVETRGGLIGDDQLGRERDGAGDPDAARLATAQLMGQAVGHGAGQSDQAQQPLDLGIEIAVGEAMDAEGLGQQAAHGEARAEGAHGILEDHGDVAMQALQRRAGEPQGRLPLEQHAAGGHRRQPDKSACQGRLAGAGFPHQGEGLALRHGKGGAGHGGDGIGSAGDQARQRPPVAETHHEIADLQQRAHGAASSRTR